jgi:hypothetical protein
VGRTAKHRPLYTICRYIPGLWCWCQSRMACADPIRLALSAIAAPSTVSKRHHDIFFSECVQGTKHKKDRYHERNPSARDSLLSGVIDTNQRSTGRPIVPVTRAVASSQDHTSGDDPTDH